MDQYVGWNLLPDNVLLNVFVMLKEKDMAHASSTCTRWRRLFYEPRLWRIVNFNIKSLCKKPLSDQEKLQNHVQAISSSVQHVTINFSSPEQMVERQVAGLVKVILDTLAENNSSILSLKLKRLQMGKIWCYIDFDYARCELMYCLCHFIESQTRLQTLVISEALLPITYGHMILSSLARSPSVDTLQHLDICYLFAFYQEYNREQAELIRSALFKCKHLKEITINNSMLKAIEVEKLCEHFQKSLKTLHLKTISTLKKSNKTDFLRCSKEYDVNTSDDYDDDDDEEKDCTYHMRYVYDYEHIPAIDSQSWKDALRFCPDLNVSVEMDLVDVDLENILAPAMPVSHLTIIGLLPDGWVEDDELDLSDLENEIGLGDILNHLCSFSLEKLKTATFIGQDDETLYLMPEMGSTISDVIKFTQEHPKLTSVKISANLISSVLLKSLKEEMRELCGLDRDIITVI